MRILSGKIEDRMLHIGYYQIAGGLLGLILTLRTFIYESTLSGLSLFFYVVAILLFVFSIYSGNLLRKKNIKGLYLSTWNQVLQLIQISISAFGFEYYSGVFFNIGFEWTEKFIPDFNFGLSGWILRYTENDLNHNSVYINLIPILILYYINKTRHEIEERKQLIESAEKLNQE
jgi:hypothetical protein